MSWTMERDVEAGRSVLNFSEWNGSNELATQAGSSVVRRDMPPKSYLILHDHAKLTDAEKVELARGLHATFNTRVSVE